MMILAPKDSKYYLEVLCIEDFNFVDEVWGDCSIVKGTWYKAIIDNDPTYHLIKFRNGLCPHLKSNFKSISEIRNDKLNDLNI